MFNRFLYFCFGSTLLFLRFSFMKRFFAIILLILYTISTVGLSAQMHYCGGEISSITINSNYENSSCGCEESSDTCSDETDKDDCCTNTKISSNPLDSQQTAISPSLPVITIKFDYSSYIPSNLEILHSISHFVFSDYSHAPPDHSSIKSPRFLQLRLLLI